MTKLSEDRGRILVVAYEPAVKDVLREFLSYDYEYEEVDSVKQALTLLRSKEFNLILVDIPVSDEGEFELLRRAPVISPDTTIMVISGRQTIDDAIKTFRAGAFDYILKPFDLILLEAAVKRALEHNQLRREKRKYEDYLEHMVEARIKEYKNTINEFTKQRENSVVVSFDFPEQVRVPCEQYLLYFAQFLKDLGVEANTALTHEAGQVLFSVTPTDKQQALDKIRSALDVYLQLPSNPISDTTNENIAIQRLESNILRLRSELKLAAAEIQAKNATIQAHEITINVQKGLLSGEIIFDSLKDVTPKAEEEKLGGIVAIKKYEGKGFEVDLPEIFRWLKRMFTTKD